ncbi:hypothetical protein LCL97_18495 [Seohaeicola saemankumensis]|nr:hypothetical protein [Seohaeicola saemankumensis]MCA0872825.1 hypothetical protein [Seohaeicola saemankumensis]
MMDGCGGWVLTYPYGATRGSVVPVIMDHCRLSDQIDMTCHGELIEIPIGYDTFTGN